jgi:hypothetical protein
MPQRGGDIDITMMPEEGELDKKRRKRWMIMKAEQKS